MIKPIPKIEIAEEFEASIVPLYVIFSDADRWPVGSISRVLTAREPETVIASLPDRSRVTISLRSLGTKTELNLVHELITDPDELKAHKKFWRDYLKTVRKQVER